MELEEKVKKLIEQGDNKNFIYEFLLLYGIPKVTITKTKNSKLKKAENQIIIKKKLFFEYYNQGVSLFETKDTDLLERINVLTNDPQTYAHDPLSIDVIDNNGTRHTVREWFQVPLGVIEEAIYLFQTGEIVNYYYFREDREILRIND